MKLTDPFYQQSVSGTFPGLGVFSARATHNRLSASPRRRATPTPHQRAAALLFSLANRYRLANHYDRAEPTPTAVAALLHRFRSIVPLVVAGAAYLPPAAAQWDAGATTWDAGATTWDGGAATASLAVLARPVGL